MTAREKLQNYLNWHLPGTNVDDLEPTETPGYWRYKKPCGGFVGGCRSPLHSCIFNDGPTHHTVRFTDETRGEKGRWVSPYSTWRGLRAAETETQR